MTEFKRSRRARIESMSKTNKAEASPEYATYWITRESAGGALSERVQVWTARPDREEVARGGVTHVIWMAYRPDGAGALHGTWSLDESTYWCGTYPDTDRQCIRNGGE